MTAMDCYKTISPHATLKNLIRVNKGFNKKEDVFKNKVYFYDAEKKTFEAM